MVLIFLLDLISIVLIVVPVTMPLVTGFGVDPLWYSVMLLVMMQRSSSRRRWRHPGF